MSAMAASRVAYPVLAGLLTVSIACSKKDAPGSASGGPSTPPMKVGLVTDIGGRGDQSFNDSELRGLELWAAGKKFTGSGYRAATTEEIKSSISPDLANLKPPIAPLPISALAPQSKAQEYYEPNLQLLVDQRVALAIGTVFMLENAVQTVARRSPGSKFLLTDSP